MVKNSDQTDEIVHTKLEAMAEKATKHHAYKQKNRNPRQPYITKKIKDERYKQTLALTQNELSKKARRTSILLHKDTVFNISEFIGNTIFRPITILLCSALTVILGAVLILWAKRVGLDYPNTILVVIFITVYPFCLIIDIIFSSIRRNK